MLGNGPWMTFLVLIIGLEFEKLLNYQRVTLCFVLRRIRWKKEAPFYVIGRIAFVIASPLARLPQPTPRLGTLDSAVP